ncbi:MAG TPA: PAS domain S-box protein [Blastocatellia bacterium]|nr:PAS domain S-box protein [Blastocatellia bacterium]
MGLPPGWKYILFFCLAGFLFCLLQLTALSQSLPTTQSIAETIKSKDRNSPPDRAGEQVIVLGVVTTVRVYRSATGLRYYIYVQDGTGAVEAAGKGEIPSIQEGDLVELKGTLGFRYGMAEISSPEFTRLGSAPVTAGKVNIASINSAQCMACLIEVTGNVKSVSSDPTTPEQHYVLIEDNSGSVYISLIGNIWVDSDAQWLQPGAQVKVIGTAEQYRDSEQSTSVLYVEVRHRGELVIVKRAPYLTTKQLLLLSGALLLAASIPLAWSQLLRRKVKAKTVELEREIVERRQSEQALIASEERYRLLFEQSVAGVYCATVDGQILECNEAVIKMFGYETTEEVKTLNIVDFYFDEAEKRRVATEFRLKGELANFEVCLKKKDGSPIWVLENVRPVKGCPNSPRIFHGIVIDISQLKKADRMLRESEDRYRDLVETSHDLICTHDLDGNILSINKGVADVLGYSRDELLSKNICDILAREYSAEFDVYLNRVKTEGVAVGVMVVETRTGEKRYWEYRNTLRTEGVDVPIVRGIGHDSTDLRRAQKALKESESELRALFGAMTDHVCVLDRNGRIIKIAPTKPAFRIPAEKDRNVYELLPAEVADQAIKNIETVLRSQNPLNVEYKLLIDSDKSWFEGQLSPLSSDSALLISRDVTSRKKAEEQLRRSQEELRQSQRLEPIGRLAGGVAHDFNNLLTAILGYSELLLQISSPDDDFNGGLQEIKKAGQRAASLTRQLLAFSRKQILQPKVINLNNTVLNLHKMLRRLIGEDIELISLLDPDLGQIKADPSQIEQVVINLAVNARDAMPNGGRIAIETANLDINGEGTSADNGLPPNKYVVLKVVDTGCGMDDETMAHIFEPFFTTKELGKGTGLGLSTVYGIVQQSGGQVRVTSKPGKGTTFKIYLPRIESAADVDSVIGKDPEPPKTKATVLVVEDEDIVLRLVQGTLRQAGYDVLTACNGVEAVQVFELNQDRIKLILTDIVMPQMGGRRLVERLLESGTNAKILFMSGYTDDSVIKDELLGDGIPLLQKPFSPAELISKIRAVLDGTNC